MCAFTVVATGVAAVLLSLPAAQADASSSGNAGAASLALDILRNLEVDTFPNSFRPKGYPEGTTVGETPFQHFIKTTDAEDGYSATDDEKTWHPGLGG